MARLGDVFENVMREIDGTLNQRKEQKRDELLKEYFKTIPVLKKKQILLDKKKAEKEKIVEEINAIETEMRNLDPSLTTEEARKKYILLGGSDKKNYYGYDKRLSSIIVDAKLCATKEYKNIRSWDEIKKQLKAQFNLCITDKNRQQVILTLQNGVDWKSLGINIPNLFDIKKVDVVDGVIYINKALPNKTQ